MNKHLILGAGNLGLDLREAVAKSGQEAALLGPGWRFPDDGIKEIIYQNPDVVWCTVGAGSVAQAKQDFRPFLELHVNLPLLLMQALPDTAQIVLFSTDYVAHPASLASPTMRNRFPRSLYAMSKSWMEDLAVMRCPEPLTRRVRVIRVGSLYGHHRPEKTFPGRLLASYPKPDTLHLPQNLVTPTPTAWLAEFIVRHLDTVFEDTSVVHHCAPLGNISVLNWGKRILGEEYKIFSKGFDPERPRESNLQCSFAFPPQWQELWEKYGRPSMGDRG